MNYQRWGIAFLVSLFLVFGVSASIYGQTSTVGQTSAVPSEELDLDEFEEFDSVATTNKTSDPLYYYNVSMFYFNDALFSYVIFPVSHVYSFILPKPVRRGVGNVFRNVGFPIRFVNTILQGKFKRSGVELSRFGINTTIGVLGIFDPAESWFGLKHHSESFGQTLGHYKVPSGPYLVLPFLGPSTLRDAFGTIADGFVNPVNRLEHTEDVAKVYTVDTLNTATVLEPDYKQIKSSSIDFYSFMKDAYLQRQKQLIAD